MSPCFRFLALALGASLASVGCGEDTSGGKSDSALDGAHDGHVHPDAGEDEEEDVPCTADYPVFTPGRTVKAGDLTVKLLSVSPEPPRQQTPNNWLLEVVDSAGAPVSGVEIKNPDSYMKVHLHHGRTQPKVVPQSEPGKVQLSAIDFKMRGPWQVNFDVVVAGGKPTAASIWICVE
jgi:hypothetical protein